MCDKKRYITRLKLNKQSLSAQEARIRPFVSYEEECLKLFLCQWQNYE